MSVATTVREFDVSAEKLYDAIADQDLLGAWLGTKVSVPTRTSGLVGTVRRVHIGPTSFDERITATEKPRALDYAIVPPMPLLKHHHGEMRIEPLGPTRARLRWSVTLELALGIDKVVLPLVMEGLAMALKRLSKRLG